LELIREGETEEVTMKSSPTGMAKKLPRLLKMLKQGWSLKDITGSDERMKARMKAVLEGYMPGQAAPVRKMLAESGLKEVPGMLKNVLKKDAEGK
jgi:hypothetical protein